MMTELLYETGIKFYNQGKYEDALIEFRKALMVSPDYSPALKYIGLIQETLGKEEAMEAALSSTPVILSEYGAPAAVVLESEREKQALKAAKKSVKKTAVVPPAVETKGALTAAPGIEKAEAKKPVTPKVLRLDDLAKFSFPIEIPKGKSIFVVGRNITKFLATVPEILEVTRIDKDNLLVTATNLGYSDLVIWDDRGRTTLEFLGVFPQAEGPTYEEMMRQEEEKARNFRLSYSFDFSGFENGSGFYKLKRQGDYSYVHNIGLIGQTPYGNLDTAATLRRLGTTDLTYVTLGLTNGQLGPFDDFSLRGGDMTPAISNLTFPGTSLRGALFNSPAFRKQLDYTLFWGRENAGRFELSPELFKSPNSFLSGVNLSYSPFEKQNYQFTLVHGWGRDRQDFLNEYGYDLSTSWNLQNWGLGYDLAYDTKKFANLFTADYTAPNLKFTSELRDVNRSFYSVTGTGWRQGELGGLFNLFYKANEKLDISSRLDVYRDRLFPAQDNRTRWNQEFDLNSIYRVDPSTDINFDYTLQNDLGKLSQARYLNPGVGLSKRFKFIRDISTFIRYDYAYNQNFSSNSLSYYNNRASTGIRFNLIGDLYYYFNYQINWLRETFNQDSSRPNVKETGIDWSGQIGKSPLYTDFRFTFRDEEDALSPLSFLSGQDYIEGYTELSYRKDRDKEIYGSCRVRNNWADSPNVTKGIELSLNTGLRYYWDTGISWNSACNIEVGVFKDLNSDGLRQRDEPPVEGVRVWVGKNKSALTDLFGYATFEGVRGIQTAVSIDMSSLPSAYLLTVPSVQEVRIKQSQTVRVDFGINTRSEINGIVFHDQDNNLKLDTGEKGVSDISIILDDKKKAVSDAYGRYTFANVSAGEHKLTLDLESIPVNYLPKAVLTKKITLFEGVTYTYNIPLEEIRNKE